MQVELRTAAPLVQRRAATARGTGLRRLAVVFALLLAVGLAVVPNYGLSTDEPWQMEMVRSNYRLLRHGLPVPGDHRYHGLVFNAAAEAAFQVNTGVRTFFDARPAAGQVSLEFAWYRERVVVKHTVTFLFTLLGYAAVAALVGILCGWRYAWIGPLVLALLPRFWAHGFFNPKDAPFAAGYTLATLGGASLVARFSGAAGSRVASARTAVPPAAAYGAVLGLVSGVRIGALVLLFAVPLCWFVVRASLRRSASAEADPDNQPAALLAGLTALGTSWFVTVWAIHPSAWRNPVSWLFESVRYLSAHPWPGRLLFEGRYTTADLLPWYYLPKYVLLTTPEIVLLAFGLGVVIALSRFRRLTVLQRAAAVMVILQLALLPAIAILKGSTMYDGLRQSLFVLPAIAVFAAAGLVWCYRLSGRGWARAAVLSVALLAGALVLRDMADLHPYEYVYFNRASGGLAGAQDRYELDYWTLSFREAIEWINAQPSREQPVLIAGNLHSAMVFAAPDVVGLRYDSEEARRVSPPHFFLALYKHGYQRLFPECPVVYRVARQGVSLALVKACPLRPRETRSRGTDELRSATGTRGVSGVQ